MSPGHAYALGLGRIVAALAFGCSVTVGLLLAVSKSHRTDIAATHKPKAHDVAIELEPPPPPPDPLPDSLVEPTRPPTAQPPPQAPPPPPRLSTSVLSKLAAPTLPSPGAMGLLPALGSGLPGGDPGRWDTAPTSAPVSTRARPIRRPTPRYPAVAQRQGIQGFVTVRLRVDRRGRVSNVVIVESQPPNVFDDAARDAARRYRFEPARRGTQVIETVVEQRIVFTPEPQ